jgi:hypothetical protein
MLDMFLFATWLLRDLTPVDQARANRVGAGSGRILLRKETSGQSEISIAK